MKNDRFMRQLQAFFLGYRENSPRFSYVLKAEHIECIDFCFCIMIYGEKVVQFLKSNSHVFKSKSHVFWKMSFMHMRQLQAFFLEYRANLPRFGYVLKAEDIECIHFCFFYYDLC